MGPLHLVYQLLTILSRMQLGVRPTFQWDKCIPNCKRMPNSVHINQEQNKDASARLAT